MTKAAKTKRTGPKPKPERDLRTHTISVRLTVAEAEALKAEAAEVGREKQVGRYLYEKHSGRVPLHIPAVNLEAWGRLGRVAGGLTTMAKAAAAMQLPMIDRLLVEQVREELREVRSLLIGGGRRSTLRRRSRI